MIPSNLNELSNEEITNYLQLLSAQIQLLLPPNMKFHYILVDFGQSEDYDVHMAGTIRPDILYAILLQIIAAANLNNPEVQSMQTTIEDFISKIDTKKPNLNKPSTN